MKIYINGKYFTEKTATVSVFDHGLLYGDGIFEGLRAYNGRVFKLKEHIDRLFDSAKAILLTIPISHDAMMKAVVDAFRKNNIKDGYARLMVTRGRGTLGLNPRSCREPQVIIIADKIQLYPPDHYTRGLDIVTAPTTRNHSNSVNPAIKSLNYLNNILAKIEANNAGVEEAIMLNSAGFVAECTGDNVFIMKNGELFTPTLSSGALYGITRNVVIDLARTAGLTVREVQMTRYDLFVADECFLTGTGAELIPVVKIDGRVIGNGKPGKTTKHLVKLYHDLTQTAGEPIYK
jgi:branched-chain amino acid aminotransferase